jgi:hypothetical protein
MAMAMPPSDMIVAGMPKQVHRDEGREHRERERDDRQQRAAQVQQEQHDDEGDDDHLLDERVPQRVDRALDEARAVVGPARPRRPAAGRRAARRACASTRSMTSSAFSP